LSTEDTCKGTCASGETWVELSKACLDSSLYAQLQSAFPLERLSTQYLKENFYRVSIQCQLYQDEQACNHLANMCVAQDYETSLPTCAKFKQLHDSLIAATSSSNFEHSITNWVPSFPFLWFSRTDNGNLLGYNAPGDEVNFNIQIPSFMTFKLFKYSLNGTYLGNETLTSQFMSLCEVNSNHATQALYFGQNSKIECHFNIYELFPKDSPALNSPTFRKHRFDEGAVFYSLFYMDSSTKILYPVPVHVQNSINNALGGSVDNAQLYTRFYLFENTIGTTREPVLDQKYVKLATSFQLVFQLRSSENIYIPYLRMQYTTRQWNELRLTNRADSLNTTTADIDNDATHYPAITWETYYFANQLLYHILFFVFFVIFLVIGVGLTILESCIFLKKKRGHGALDIEFSLKLIFFVVKNLSNAIFAVLFFQCLFWFWFFKNQRSALLLLPLDVDLIPYYICLPLGFILKLLQILIQTHVQTRLDLFFIDWEKTRGKIIENEGRSATGNVPISIWRTIYVARAWKKLSLKRQVSLEITLLFTLFFITGIGLIDLSSTFPNWNIKFGSLLDTLNIGYHPLLRYAIFSMVYVLTWGLFFVFKKYFWFRFIHNPITQFIDFCSVANISVLLLTERYFGYYIHGESVHQYSDTNMKEFNQNLYMEKEDAVLRRGLVADSPAQEQVFQIFLTEQFRNMYQQKLLIPLHEERAKAKNRYNLLSKTAKVDNTADNASGPLQEGGITVGFDERRKRKTQFEQIRLWKFLNPNWQRAPVESLYDAYTDLNEYLKGFFNKMRIDQQNIREMQLTNRLGIPPNLKKEPSSILYIDHKNSFTKSLLWDMETTFVVFNIFAFALFDLIFMQIPYIASIQSAFLAVFIVYLLNAALFLIRKYMSHWNTANKTLLDQRFL